MKTLEIISELRKCGVSLRVDNGQLKLAGKTGELSKELLQIVRDNKQEVIDFIDESNAKSGMELIPTVAKQSFYPLSNAQRRIWVLSQFEGGSSAYNIMKPFHLVGDVNIPNLERAFQLSIAKHESLRTVFQVIDDVPVQVIQDEMPFQIDVFDLSDKQNTKELVNEKVEQSRKYAFDLENGPLLKMDAHKINDKEYAVVFCLHHIISDGWSIGVLVQEAMGAYRKICQGKPTDQEELQVHYKDYSSWLEKKLSGEFGAKARNFWSEKKLGEVAPLKLITDFERPSMNMFEGALKRFYFKPGTYERIEAFAKANKTTVFIVFRAALSLCLHKESSQNEVIIGTPVSARSHFQLANQIGVYANTLPLLSEYSANQSFEDYLREISDDSLEAFKYQEYPLDTIIEGEDIARDPSRNPLFDVMMVVQNTAVGDGSIDITNQHGFKMNMLESYLRSDNSSDVENGSAKFDLSFSFSVEPVKKYFVEIEYRTKLFNKQSIELFYKRFIALLDQVMTDVRIPLKEVDFLLEHEKQELLHTFNNTAHEYNSQDTILDLFKKQVKNTPENTALVFESQELSYAELDAKSEAFAAFLQKTYTIEKGDFVGIHLNRSERMIIAILGVIKAGAAYVPLAPDYPQDRVTHIANECAFKVTITSEVFHDFHQCTASFEWSNPHITGEDIAYVIFTSGSTGAPKGVQVKHSNLASFTCNFPDVFGLENVTRMAATTNYTFDISIIELLGILSQGITIDLFSDQVLADPEYIAQRIKDQKIDGLQVTPSRCSQLLIVSDDFHKNLNVLLIGGEAVNKELFTRLQSFSSKVVQVYGPTETTIWSTSMEITKTSQLTIGKPLKNQTIFILNDELQMVPKRVAGEICIGGVGVSAGYLNRKDLTQQNFVQNPYNTDEIMYRTGDLGKWTDDGNIIFLGRKDDQVKIRGHRIELGEITNVLISHEDILEAVVVAKKVGGSELELVAYYVSETTPEPSDLKQHLGQKVPGYMIPSYFVKMEEMPLSRSGKINRKELPEPSGFGINTQEIVPAANKTEAALLKLWNEVLDRSDFGVEHNFFELGGHSLKATVLKSLIIKELGKNISLNEIFQMPTVRQLGTLVDGKSKQVETKIVKIEEQEEQLYPLSLAQERLWVLTKFDDASKAYHMPAAFRVNGKLDTIAFEKAIVKVIERHESLRTVFFENTQGAYQKILAPSEVNFALKQIDVIAETSLQQFLMDEWSASFDLENGPLVRCSLIDFDGDQIVSFNMHHIISDGWSIGILFKDVLEAYQGILDGKSAMFSTELEIQYKDFTIWQKEHLTDAVLEAQLTYWKEDMFGNGALPLNLPFGEDRPAVKTYNGAIAKRQFSKEITARLSRQAKDQGASLFMSLMANVSLLLNKLSGQSNITIGTPVAGRDSSQLQQQIGFYVNTLPINQEVDNSLNFLEFLAQEQAAILSAFDYQNFPFELLVEAIQPKRDLSRSPLFDVMVTYQNFDLATNAISGLDFERVPVWNAHTKYDLTFVFSEENDQLILELEYNTDLFSPAAAEKYIGFFEKIIDITVSTPEVSMGSISLVSESEEKELIEVLNKPIQENSESGIFELIAPTFASFADKTALKCKDKKWSYHELDKMSDAFAHKFTEAGAERIGLFLKRDETVLAAVLGAIKSGTTYVPIDVTYPEDRINYIIEDAQIDCIVTNKKEALPTTCKVKVLDTNMSEYSGFEVKNVPSNQTAYLIYTSGSTGKPKGVEISHGNVIAFLKWANLEFGNTPFETLYAATSYCFDLSMFEMLFPLTQGKEIRYLESALEIQEFLPLDQRVMINTVPSMVRGLLDQGISWENVVALNMAGEPVPKIFKETLDFHSMEVRNLYGPSEDTTYSTCYRFTEDNLNFIPIGTPVGDTHAYILDKNGNLVPQGVEGEICLSGESVANGYFGKKELTEEKFIPNPFVAGKRMYKTGDIGKWQNGLLCYVGRMDDQVKVRGFRIELGEIQYRMECIHGVSQAVVVLKEVNKEKEIVAYYESQETITKETIQEALSAVLPSYMVPNYFVVLEKIPLNSNGKVDKKQLPEPEVSKTEYSAPQNEIEAELANIWQKILGVDLVGTKDNFFDLGGHSLKATRVVTAIQESFGVKIDLKNLFIDPTIEHLAKYVETLKWMEDSSKDVPSEEDELIL